MMLRDASGNFAANQGKLNTLVLDNGAGSNITVITPVAFTSWQLKLPDTAGTANQVLQTDGSGNTSWATSTGLPAVAGTAAAPGYAFSGNTNTGMFAAATNQIGLATNGTEKVRVDASGNMGVGVTAPAAKLEVAGEVKVGNTSIACSATTKGAIRYNNATSVLEFCNGTAWNLVQAAACTDVTPNAFAFSNQANQTPSTLVTSDIVQVAGINCSVPVQISGSGSPQYRICSDSGCTAVVQDWTNSPSSITTGQYMQVQQTSDAAGGVTTQATVIVGSGASVWSVSTTGDCSTIPATYPAIGTVCADGTVYAGLSPDGNVAMYATRCDAGKTWDGSNCTGSATTMSWNNGTTNWSVTGVTGNTTGKSNTTTLAGLANVGAPYIAANYCDTLDLHGKTDWYLPAPSELNVLYTNKAAIRNFDISGTYYWSSAETYNNAALVERLSDGNQNTGLTKNAAYKVRCVRR